MFHFKRWLFISIWSLFIVVMVACSSNPSMNQESTSPSNEKKGVRLDQNHQTSQDSNPKENPSIKNAEKLGRKITYKAILFIDVDNYQKSRRELEESVHKAQGYLVDSREENYKKTHKGTFTYRVPQNHFHTFMNDLKTISPDGTNITIKGNDVTDEWVDLNARLKAKKTTEKRLLDLMNQATGARELLDIAEKLDRIQVEIEQIEGRQNHLKHLVDFSEVTVTLSQEVVVSVPDNDSMGRKMKDAFFQSAETMFNVAKILLIIFAAAIPVVIPIGLLVVPIYLSIHKRRKKKKSDENIVED